MWFKNMTKKEKALRPTFFLELVYASLPNAATHTYMGVFKECLHFQTSSQESNKVLDAEPM